MLLRVLKARLVVLPLAVLLLLFSAGTAAAPDCHVETTAPTTSQSAAPHSHAGIPHDHSQNAASAVASGNQGLNVSTSNAINYEICFVVGFIVLLSFRFLRIKNSIFKVKQFLQPKLLMPQLLSKNLGYLNLNHLKLGIIRI
jgi:hypothetical protein